MTDFTWKITSYEVREVSPPLSNVVVSVGWEVSGSRDGVARYRMGVTELPEANTASFVVWESVTNALALDWVRAELAAQPGLTDINGDEPNYLAYLLSNIETELDNIPPPTVILPPKPDEPPGDE